MHCFRAGWKCLPATLLPDAELLHLRAFPLPSRLQMARVKDDMGCPVVRAVEVLYDNAESILATKMNVT
jgi:hypothetical protein